MVQNANATDPHIPQELIRAIRQKECILLVGPGLARHIATVLGGSPPVSWEDTLSQLVDICKLSDDISSPQEEKIEELLSNGAILEASKKLQEYLRTRDESQNLLGKRLEEIMLCNQVKVGEVHRLIAKAPFCMFCTINYDRFIEDAYFEVYGVRPATFDLSMIEAAKIEYRNARKAKTPEQKFVLKLLGDVDHVTSLNLWDRYLQTWIIENNEKKEALKDMFSKASVLLIGFEPENPDLEGWVSNSILFKKSSRHHNYILLERTTEKLLMEKESFIEKMEPIWYDSDIAVLNLLRSIAGPLEALKESTQFLITGRSSPPCRLSPNSCTIEGWHI